MAITQYGSFFSIFILLILISPAIMLGVIGKSFKNYVLVISIPIIYMFIGDRIKYFCIFLTVEILLIYLYYRLKDKFKTNYFYYGILCLSISPVIYSKLNIYTDWKSIEFLGMSYLGFRIWQIIIEIHDNNFDKFSLKNLLYFIAFFPTISSGPIDRYKRFTNDVNLNLDKEDYFNHFFIIGIKKIVFGIVYKFAFADFIYIFFIKECIEADMAIIDYLKYMYLYTFYLFFDFAGYSNMAIGTGYLIGIKVPENFNKPFLARNMKEFWERWHMSLSRWFGDFVFTRIVLNLLRNGIVRNQKNAVRVGYMLTMTLMGFWHGFTLYYVLYGIYQGAALVFTDMYLKSKAYRKHIKMPYYNIISRFICFHIVSFGLLIFSGYLIKF